MIKVTLKIDGMMCGMCESHVNDTIRRDFKVKKVTSSHTKGETVILCDVTPDEDRLRDAIAKTGYTVQSMTQEAYEKQGFFARWKK